MSEKKFNIFFDIFKNYGNPPQIVIPSFEVVIPAKAGIPIKKEWKGFPPSRE